MKKNKLFLSLAASAILLSTPLTAHAAKLNGWLLQDDTKDRIYLHDGKADTGKHYQQLPSILGDNKKGWYLTDDGKALSGVQKWAGSLWYFEPSTYQLIQHRDYVKAQDGKYHMVDKDGRVLSGVQEWQGSYWYFNADGTLYTKRDYIKSQWGDWYLVDQGRVQSGLQEWAGSLWYFDPTTYLLVKNQDITVDGVTYHADSKGVLKETTRQGFDESQINYTYALASWQGSPYQTYNWYIILHDVGAESGGAANANYLRNNWTSAYTQFVVGDGGQVYEVGEPGYIAYGALDANAYSPVQIELARTWDRNTFIKDYTSYINVARYYSQKYGIPLNVDYGGKGTHGNKTHNWVTENIGGSHVDPYGYLKSWGIDYDQLNHDIMYGINQSELNKTVYSSRQ